VQPAYPEVRDRAATELWIVTFGATKCIDAYAGVHTVYEFSGAEIESYWKGVEAPELPEPPPLDTPNGAAQYGGHTILPYSGWSLALLRVRTAN
jgi:hypothetical protein